MIFLQAQSDGRAAYVIMSQHCSRDIMDLEITQLNHDFDNSTIEADVGVTRDSNHHPLCPPPQRPQRPSPGQHAQE